MASLLQKSLTNRVIKSALANYATPIGTEGESSFASAGMTLIGQPDEREMSAMFRIAEGGIDDDGDIVNPSGCVLDRYRANPIVLFHHDKDSPGIGVSEDNAKNLALTIKDNEIVAKCFFHGLPFRGVNLSEEVFNLVCKGALRGASIGFLPIEARQRGRTKEDGYHFTKYLLTEWSITPIPSNADTLRMCLSRGYVKSLALRTRLEKLVSESPQWANGIDLGEKTMTRKLGVANIEFDRDVYKSLKDCKAFLAARGGDASIVDECSTLWIFKQSDLTPGAGRKQLAKGVYQNLGLITKSHKDDEEDDPNEIEPDGDIDDVPAETETAIEETETPVDEMEAADEPEEVADPEAMKAEATDLAMRINHFKAYLAHAAESPGPDWAADKIAKLNADIETIVADLTEGFGANYAEHAIDALAPMAADPMETPAPIDDVTTLDDEPLDDEIQKNMDEMEEEKYAKALRAGIRKLETCGKTLGRVSA